MYIPQTKRPLTQSSHSQLFRQKKRRNDSLFRFTFRKRMRNHNPLACFLPAFLALACQPSRPNPLSRILQLPSQQKGNTNLRLFSVITKYFLGESFKIHALLLLMRIFGTRRIHSNSIKHEDFHHLDIFIFVVLLISCFTRVRAREYVGTLCGN